MPIDGEMISSNYFWARAINDSFFEIVIDSKRMKQDKHVCTKTSALASMHAFSNA